MAKREERSRTAKIEGKSLKTFKMFNILTRQLMYDRRQENSLTSIAERTEKQQGVVFGRLQSRHHRAIPPDAESASYFQRVCCHEKIAHQSPSASHAA